MTSNELEKLLQQAWSFPGLDPPSGAEELGTIEADGDTYHLYKGLDKDGGRDGLLRDGPGLRI